MAKTSIPVPRTDAQAEQQLAQIGALDRDIAAAKVARDQAVALLEATHATQTKPLIEQAERLREGLEEWAVKERSRLTDGDKRKTVQLTTGTIAWKTGGATVEIEGDEAKILAAISKRIETLDRKIQDDFMNTRLTLMEERATLQGFIRLKTELDKQALKKRPEVAKTIRGVRIVPGEERFSASPLASQIREVA